MTIGSAFQSICHTDDSSEIVAVVRGLCGLLIVVQNLKPNCDFKKMTVLRGLIIQYQIYTEAQDLYLFNNYLHHMKNLADETAQKLIVSLPFPTRWLIMEDHSYHL